MRNKSFKIIAFSMAILMGASLYGQETKKIYDTSLDGMKQIKEAVSAAKTAGKQVLIQYGGNWCSWCMKFDAWSKADPDISKIIADSYIAVKLNYSPENYNYESNVFLGNPSRFGFPVFIIVDGKGKVLHIQDSALLEEGQGYSKQKVVSFLNNWTASAVIPKPPKQQAKK